VASGLQGFGWRTVGAGTEGENKDARGGVEAVAGGNERGARLQGVEQALSLGVAVCQIG
jgi:hypothetical protein